MNQNQLARQNFYQEINQADENINLAKAALYIAQEEYPQLNIDEYINALDTMANEVKERLPDQRYPLRIINTINQYIYQDLGFQGNTKDYYSPQNSFLNDVIDQRAGIPITLSLIYLEIAQRLDFPMVGIGMPGHFLIRPNFDDVGIFVNAFNNGETLFEQDCEELLTQIYQQPVKMQAQFLEKVSNRHFLARMLTNLKHIYLQQRQLTKALTTVERILLLFPSSAIQMRDQGLIKLELKQWEQACQDLEFYLAMVPNAEDAPIIRQLLDKIR